MTQAIRQVIGTRPVHDTRRKASAQLPRPAVRSCELRRKLLHAAQGALYLSGISRLYLRRHRQSGAVILMYHSVAGREDAQWIDPANHLTPDLFEWQIGFLARHRHVVSMNELIDAIACGRTLPAGTVVLTFDDGYLDNLRIAAPILSRHGLPATLYLATGYIERQAPQWIDELYSLFRARTCPSFRPVPGPTYDLTDPPQARRAYELATERLLRADREQRQRWLADYADQLRPASRPPRLTLSWDDVRELVHRYPLFEIGAHTRDHVDLSALGAPAVRDQMHASVEDVRRELGQAPVHFSYPYGRYAAEQDGEAELGLRSAVVSGRDVLIRAGSDPLRMPRLAAPSSKVLFAFWTSGAYPDLPRKVLGRA